PGNPISFRQLNSFAYSGLGIAHWALEITSLDAVLHSDVARVIFPVYERCAVPLFDFGEFLERNLLAIRGSHQQVADLIRTTAELRLHTHHKIKQLFALDDLCRSLTTHRGLYHCLDIRHVNSVPRDLFPVHIDE